MRGFEIVLNCELAYHHIKFGHLSNSNLPTAQGPAVKKTLTPAKIASNS